MSFYLFCFVIQSCTLFYLVTHWYFYDLDEIFVVCNQD